jgi:hypothetical protein
MKKVNPIPQKRLSPTAKAHQFAQRLALLADDDKATYFHEGELVRLKAEKIQGLTDYARMLPTYREFVESNTDRVFTVKRCLHQSENKLTVVEFEEDSKWLFWAGDLERVEPKKKS